MASRDLADPGPRFDRPVPEGGYAWWYLDGWSEDGRHGLTIIAFVGSVFSPYYALARRRGLGYPENHCALNVALYGPGGRWAMTERGRRHVRREPERFVIGPSELVWDGSGLTIRFEEICAPVPKRLKGEVRVSFGPVLSRAFAIDGEGRHEWRPIAPMAEIDVRCESPALSWRGDGYLDFNEGSEPLEAAFSQWIWGRARTRDGALVLYDVSRRRGAPLSLGIAIDGAGRFSSVAPPPVARSPRLLWGMPRPVWRDAGRAHRIEARLEDAPFYSRSRIATTIGGEEVSLMHESLSLDRFGMPVVQAMLPFRMPRRG